MASALLRFNLSNGLISVFGTVLCTGILTGFAKLNPLLANVLSLGPCCVINYLVSDRLIFMSPERGRIRMKYRTAGRGRYCSQYVCALATSLSAAAAILQMRTVQSWNLYIQQTEKRIASELRERIRVPSSWIS